MSKRAIHPPGMAPTPGYSYAVRKSGTPVHIAGQVAIDGDGRIVGAGDPAAQVEQAFQNLRAVVEAAGGGLGDVVKINVYVTDPAVRPAFVEARKRWFAGETPPASTYVVVAGLALPELLVEIEAVAMID